MFADACQRAIEYTRPVVVSTRLMNGEVRTECGSFIVLNREGWMMTAAHLYDSYSKFQTDQNKIREIEALNESRRSRPGAPSSDVKPDPEYITNHSFWWGWDPCRMRDVKIVRQLDLAVGKLENFDPSWVRSYPVLADPSRVRRGGSLCRMGFPFLGVGSKFDEEHNSFRIPRIPSEALFCNDGIHTRDVFEGKTTDGVYDRLFIETSTPGLKGQSGGPIFDRDGMIHGMQITTKHLPIGFRPTAEYDGRSVVENQFLNVGVGVHVRVIREVLDSLGVRYDAEGDETGFRIVG